MSQCNPELNILSLLIDIRSSYDFSRNISFRANTHLRNTRSDNHRLTPEPPQVDIWKRKPPDFRPQVGFLVYL